jgi:predicted phage terminase large subunit-like protein
MPLSEAELIEKDLLEIDLARTNYLDFARYAYRGWQDSAHVEILAAYLQEVERYVATQGREGIGRLLIFMPPRHGKSLNSSTLFPAWFLGRNPDCKVIIASYNSSLATGFSRQARNVVLDNPYRAVFGDLSAGDPVQISGDSRSVERWTLEGHRGGMVAAGVGSGITGKGAHLMIIDDPHKDRADAESKARRDAVWNWWTSTAYTRLENNAAVIGILTRWHADDWAGRLLRQMVEEPGADRWEVLCLPAIAEEWAEKVEPDQVREAVRSGWWMGVDPMGREPGQALWPVKYSIEALQAIKANIGGYDFDALYQQRPWRTEGAMIKARKIKIIDREDVPRGMRLYRYWDLAVGRKKADWLSGVLGGRDRQKNFYIIDIARIPAPWSSARPRMIDVMLNDPMEVVQGIEIGGQQDGYYQNFRDDDRLHMRAIEAVLPKGDKEARAQLWGTRIEDGKVFMVRGPWNDDFIAEAVAFPNGANDDQVDGVSGVWQMCPGYVAMSDLPQAPTVPSRWDPFGEIGGMAELAGERGRWGV